MSKLFKEDNMQKVVLTNIASRYEAERMYSIFLQAIRKNNTHCTLATMLAIGIAMAIMAVSRIYFPEDIFLMICVFTSAIMLFVVYASVHSMEYECPLEWPAPYIYHKLLEDGKILKSEVCKSEDGRYDLCFTVSDNNNRVTQAWCKGLEQVVRRDIKEWMVDLTAREVLIPYITN